MSGRIQTGPGRHLAGAVVLLAALAASAPAIQPTAGDRVLFDGRYELGLGTWTGEFFVPAGTRVTGLYLGVAELESFRVRLNGREVFEAEVGVSSRAIYRTIDLSRSVKRLRPGTNRLEVRALEPADSFALRFWTSPRAWFLGSLHSHTTYSDGVLSVHELLDWVEREGADFFAITDHNTLAHQLDTAFHPVGGLVPMGGVEWTTDSGHANLLGVLGQEHFTWGGPIAAMIDDASFRGGLVVVNHPRAFPWEWQRYPAWDEGLDAIELLNGRTGFAPGGLDNSQAAIDWWQQLLTGGRAVAATANSDFHNPPEHPLRPCSRILAGAVHPDSILAAVKQGRVMACDRHDRSKLHVYADTDADGCWDVQAGDHATLDGPARPVRFRVEAEEAGPGDHLCLYRRTGLFCELAVSAGGDTCREWVEWLGAADTDFVRAELRRGGTRPGICANPVYVNYPGYELGPVRLETEFVSGLEDRLGWQSETLRFRLVNHSGVSPHRFGLVVAFDTATWRIGAWQASGPGVGRVGRLQPAGRYRVLEWQGGYEWGNRLRPGSCFDYWVVVAARPYEPGIGQVLFRSWADDRLQAVAEDPSSGEPGLLGFRWRREDVRLAPRDGGTEPGGGELPSATVVQDRADAQLSANDRPCRLTVYDGAGRSVLDAGFPAGVPAGWRLCDAAGSRLATGIYFLRVSDEEQTEVRRLLVVR
ncbi:CehA/McbA family metallohydrolase [candidate division WOR-3 bacterium]|nr:CehA/McbA family metallohydrolase [candidate division WOR-3 bacterium]